MNRDEILGLLQEHKATLAQRFGVNTLTLFGSVARDQAKDNSDVDILVSLDGPTHWQRFFGAQFYLEDLLGRQVDLAADKDLRPEIRPYVDKEAINVW